MKKTHEEILNAFVYDNPGTDREWMMKPFNAFGKTCTTNSYELVAVPIIGEHEARDEKVNRVYPLEQNMDKIIPLSVLRDKVAQFPKVPAYDEREIQCKACDNSGTVDFEFDYGRQTYYHEDDCPVCDGLAGQIIRKDKGNGEVVNDEDEVMKIGVGLFYPARFEKLLFVAEKLNADIHVVRQTTPSQATLFRVGLVDVLLMPALTDREPCVTIEL